MKRVGARYGQGGFMLIELLVVMAIIAILATIVMVGYSAVQNRTYDSTVQADLASDGNILAQFRSVNGDYPTGIELASLSQKLGFVTANYDTSNNAVLYCYSADNMQMSLIGKSKTGTVYYVTNSIRTPQTLSASFPQGAATDCQNSGLPAGSTGFLIHTSASGWLSWVK